MGRSIINLYIWSVHVFIINQLSKSQIHFLDIHFYDNCVSQHVDNIQQPADDESAIQEFYVFVLLLWSSLK